MSRKEKGTKNREKARVKVACAYARVADVHENSHDDWSTRLINDNQVISAEP
ncbi:hypothetical protein [Streptomyces sp. NPDC026673]|uniref:hypothetical protein n=1 Tax=Streptomyces sp. NPDC026673 TaxID=3155724 RepID=UPI0033D3EAB1